MTARRASSTRDSVSSDLVFRPSARLQRYLGREMISDPNLAVIEFVKNAYDAGASRVDVRFFLTEDPSRLVIADNGVGMSFASFTENWMQPGFSAKSDEAPEAIKRRRVSDSESGQRMATRLPVGEKGLGRLAAGRLGAQMDVYTRPSSSKPWLHVYLAWDMFDDMTKHMDEIVIPHEYVTKAPESSADGTGTIVVITNLELDWSGKVVGRPAIGRSRTRLGRLREDLNLLLRPLAQPKTDFTVGLDSDAIADEDDPRGDITPSTAIESAPYRYDFEVSVSDDGEATVKRTLRRSAAMAKQFHRPRIQPLPGGSIGAIARDEDRPSTLLAGPFSGVFLYSPPPAKQRARAEDVIGHGVLLYRDGVLVEPYGLGDNDWVGVEARKAQRQGHAMIQPATLWGEVHIGRATNPRLRDMANRQGLLEDETSEEFLSHIRAEFSVFESVVGPELEQRWVQQEDRVSSAAREQLRAVTLRTKTFAHHLRQPLFGIGGELVRLRRLAADTAIPTAQRARLKEICDRLVQFQVRAESLVNRYAKAPSLDYETVLVSKLMRGVQTQTADLAGIHGVTIDLDVRRDRALLIPREFVEDAIAELVINAIEATRPEGRKPKVDLIADSHGTEVVIQVIDNGTGLIGVSGNTSLAEITVAPTKDRPAGGLVQVWDIVTFARGTAEVVSTSEAGTTIEVRFRYQAPRSRSQS
jgi:signal transduction histidine kinase